MIDKHLFEEVETLVRGSTGIERICDEDARKFLAAVAGKFLVDPRCQWWWQSLKEKARVLPYEDGDGLNQLADLLRGKESARFVVTNDECPPWLVYGGRVDEFISLLHDCRFFEYFVVSTNVDWIVFDTHHNELIVVGL